MAHGGRAVNKRAGRDGLTLCAAIRKIAPIIVVTSRASGWDELMALNLGSDDYVTKPYNIPVLLARIKAVLRRNGGEMDTLEAAGLRLSLTRGVVTALSSPPDKGTPHCKKSPPIL